MSGSYDRLGGRPLHGGPAGHLDAHDDVLTAAPTFATTPHAHAGPTRPRPRRRRSAAADPLLRARRLAPAEPADPAPIVPPGSVTGHSLTLVISIMCFLASLTAAPST